MHSCASLNLLGKKKTSHFYVVDSSFFIILFFLLINHYLHNFVVQTWKQPLDNFVCSKYNLYLN